MVVFIFVIFRRLPLMSFSFGFEVDDETGNVVSFWYIYSMVYIHYFNLYSKFNL